MPFYVRIFIVIPIIQILTLAICALKTGDCPRILRSGLFGAVYPSWFFLFKPSSNTGYALALDTVTWCGHCHDGRFALPGGLDPVGGFHHHTHWHHRDNDAFIQASAGLKTVGLPIRSVASLKKNLLRLVKAYA